jgi:hypothetical protein
VKIIRTIHQRTVSKVQAIDQGGLEVMGMKVLKVNQTAKMRMT